MPSPGTSEDHLHNELRSVLDSNAQTQRMIQSLITEMRQPRPTGNSSININAGGISAGLALGISGVALAMMFLMSLWLMLNLNSLREEVRTTRQDLQDQQSAWVAVMQQKVNEVKK